MKQSNQSSPYSKQAGFTLVELIVVIAIVIVMTGIVLANVSGFRPRLELAGVAQEVATTIRQGQAYGAALRSATIGLTEISGRAADLPRHALVFSPGNTFYFLADRDNSNSFEIDCGSGNPGTECVERYNFRGGISVTEAKLCTNTTNCANDAICLVFQVAEMNPSFGRWISGSGRCEIDAGIQRAEIYLANNRGDSAEIEVWLTGFIGITLNDPS